MVQGTTLPTSSWYARHASEDINRLPFTKLSQEMEML